MASLLDHSAGGQTVGYSFSQSAAAPVKQHGFYPYETKPLSYI
jgi:20S proteasome subunit beta 6